MTTRLMSEEFKNNFKWTELTTAEANLISYLLIRQYASIEYIRKCIGYKKTAEWTYHNFLIPHGRHLDDKLRINDEGHRELIEKALLRLRYTLPLDHMHDPEHLRSKFEVDGRIHYACQISKQEEDALMTLSGINDVVSTYVEAALYFYLKDTLDGKALVGEVINDHDYKDVRFYTRSVYLKQEVIDAIETFAKEAGITPDDVVHLAIKAYLIQKEV